MAVSSIPITSLGLLTNLGTAVHAAAAQRAGLVRRAPLPEYVTLDADTEMEAPVIAAPITGVTDGFMPPGLWLRLAAAALEDLITYGGLPAPNDTGFWRRTGVNWVLPELAYARFLWSEDDIPAILAQTCVAPLLDLTGLPIVPSSVHVLPSGSAGAVAASRNAAEVVADGGLDRIVLLATDSWLDPLSMRALIDENRIKSDTQPAGFCPGEAGAAVLLESERGAAARGGRAQASVIASAHVAAPAALADAEDPSAARIAISQDLGRRLADIIQRALTEGGTILPFRGTVVLDLNGEEWRAHAWGWAQMLLANVIDFGQATVIMPAVEFGDTGAASGVLAMCLATRALARGYAQSDRFLICSVSESGVAGALLIGGT